jgi:hypothetical protein
VSSVGHRVTGVSDSSTAWAVVAAALGAALLTSAASFGLEQVRARRVEERQRLSDVRRVCGELISSAHRLAHRSGFLHLTMYSRSGFNESIDIVMHHRKPIDLMELGDYLDQDFGPMLQAQASIWMIGDEELILAASQVILAAGDVIAKSTALPQSATSANLDAANTVVQKIKSFKSLKQDPALEAARVQSIRELGRACWSFGQVTRKHLNVDVDDLMRAFPTFSDQSVEQDSPTAAEPESAGSDEASAGISDRG